MPVWSKYSRGSGVVSKQAAESLSTAYSSAVAFFFRRGEEEDVSFALVISLGVEMRDEFTERPLQRVFAEENELGEAFLLDGSDPPFGEGVRMCLQMRRMATLRTELSG